MVFLSRSLSRPGLRSIEPPRASNRLREHRDDRPSLTLVLTREQQLEVLAATGFMVSTLELPLDAVEDGEEALARLPLPEWLKERLTGSEGKEVKEDDPVAERGSDSD